MGKLVKHTSTLDMTQGMIPKLVMQYAVPMMLGNLFQILYNTVDSIVVGNYVGTQALAAVGSTGMIIGMTVAFFNGFSLGAGVIIGKYFGAKEFEKLHRTVETTITMALVLCAVLTAVGTAAVKPLLRLMDTPEDVLPQATRYLRIYYMGISGLLMYNIGSAIVRAVGDTKRPLYFLILTSLLNIVLDILFVIVFQTGVAGVAYATIISQFVSALLVLRLLTVSQDFYHLRWNELGLDWEIFRQIVSVGIPTGLQSVISQLSNVFVQSYINAFGSSCMAGWSCYNKVEQFVFQPVQSISATATAFVSQNIGAEKWERADRGTFVVAIVGVLFVAVFGLPVMFLAEYVIRLFTSDTAVVAFGVLFIQTNGIFIFFNCVNFVFAGALRGMGDSRAPMIIMILNFVVFRQLYLFLLSPCTISTPQLVGLGYPVGWVGACLLEVIYYLRKRRHMAEKQP